MDKLNKPLWITKAYRLIGTREIKGLRHNPTIINWLINLGAWWRDDETPWCGAFVAQMLDDSDRYVVPKYYRAKAWADDNAMTRLDKPAYGCIVVFNRKGGGHVGFVVGKQGNKICVLGGNQNDEVNVKAFSTHNVIGYYWASRVENGKPIKSVPYKERYQLPELTVSKAGKVI